MVISKLKHIVRKVRASIREGHKENSRSPQWCHVRDKFLKENSNCAACGSERHLQVHHVKPFHLHPELELDPANFITLCMDTNECHLNIGHGDSFSAYNPNVREDAADFLKAGEEARRLIEARAKAQRLL
jgi:5-methylcytosine-specific restriction endonuclease McrA